jgi:nitrate reductase gamma subunit
MLSVEACMVYFPFSRLMHAFTFAFSRAYTGASYGRRGVVP